MQDKKEDGGSVDAGGTHLRKTWLLKSNMMYWLNAMVFELMIIDALLYWCPNIKQATALNRISRL